MLEISAIDEKMAIVKAIGNAGIVDFFPDIERIIKDKTEPAVIRKEAIFALRRLTSVAPMAVSSLRVSKYDLPQKKILFVLFGHTHTHTHNTHTHTHTHIHTHTHTHICLSIKLPISDLRSRMLFCQPSWTSVNRKIFELLPS